MVGIERAATKQRQHVGSFCADRTAGGSLNAAQGKGNTIQWMVRPRNSLQVQKEQSEFYDRRITHSWQSNTAD